MTELLLAFQLAIELGFATLAIRAAVSWLRQPDPRHRYLALGVGAIAALILISPAIYGGGFSGRLATDAAVVLFLASGYALLMFRDSFVPLGRGPKAWITAGFAALAILAVAARLPADPATATTPAQSAVLVVLFCAWAASMLEPVVRFWLASSGRPAVERARLRSLSAGYMGLLAVVVAGTLAGASTSPPVTLVIDLFALAVVPSLYVAFFPPTWLRRIWGQPEEDHFRHALHDLLMYSPDRVTLAQRALGWSARLLGGDAAFVIDSDGTVLAARGMSILDAREMTGTNRFIGATRDGQAPWREGPIVFLPLDLHSGRGAIVIISGRLTPLFGDEEMSRLRQYASSISAGLDRVTLNTRIHALEQAKSEFLNVASHELRGPMTVIKGYLTMLEAGSLGDVAPKAQSVLPLLISKADEVNWMLEQMIEASRLEEGKLALKLRRQDVVELADYAIEGVRMLLAGHEISVEKPRRHIEAEVDADRFQIVVRNLLSNAAKYSPSGTRIEVAIKQSGDEATIAVTDQGVGISAQDQPNLFTRFGRIANTQHVQGTGLGLWLSREIARMHNGDLTVDSEVGRGSTFVFKVPVSAG
ncbi:MAG TPA: ATP-binding protein [Candidatus Dormibacteraeota bacterium]|nr:ATP-binding protein [Candidatus Dormibacteraeota bacterium]